TAGSRGLEGDVRAGAEEETLRRDHHRGHRRSGVLFRRGLSPAISGEKSVRLLWPRRHRRVLSDRHWCKADTERAGLRAVAPHEVMAGHDSGETARKLSASYCVGNSAQRHGRACPAIDVLGLNNVFKTWMPGT